MTHTPDFLTVYNIPLCLCPCLCMRIPLPVRGRIRSAQNKPTRETAVPTISISACKRTCLDEIRVHQMGNWIPEWATGDLPSISLQSNCLMVWLFVNRIPLRVVEHRAFGESARGKQTPVDRDVHATGLVVSHLIIVSRKCSYYKNISYLIWSFSSKVLSPILFFVAG